MKIVKTILYFLLLLAMAMPLLQYRFGIFVFKPLDGFFKPVPSPSLDSLTFSNWLDESFQRGFNKAVEDNLGFRNLLIRINNQLNYSLFHYTDNKKVVIGKNDCLFEEGYITEYTGKDFIGKKEAEKRILTLKKARYLLKTTKNIDLILVFEPGKASFHSEYIPDRYHPEKRRISNHEYMTGLCRENNILHIDLNAWFLSLKNKSPYPLYPEYGVHWSKYGTCIAMDTIIRFIEKIRGIKMPRFDYKDVEYSDQWVDADFDIEKTLNLLFPLSHRPMAYPRIRFVSDSLAVKPEVLIIGDSYCWSIYDFRIPQNIFRSWDYWYYNRVIWPDIWTENHLVSKLNFKEEIEKKEVILIMITEMNLHDAFWGFPEEVCKYFGPRNN